MRDNKTKAVLFMLLSTVSFTFMSVFIKLSGDIPIFEKVFFRNFVTIFIAFALVRKEKQHCKNKKESIKFLILRSTLGLAGVILNFYAVNNLLLADSSMLNKVSPFFVTLFAFVFLKEKPSKLQIPVLIAVFAGAMLVIKPEMSLSILPAIAGFSSAMCAAGAYTVIRHLKDKVSSGTIVLFFSMFSVAVMAPLMIYVFKMPTPIQWFYLIMIGVSASFGQIGLTVAYKNSNAGEISIYNYSSIIFAAIAGFIVWGEVPDIMSVTGGTIILGAALLLFLHTQRTSHK